jgi:hypothetical protein
MLSFHRCDLYGLWLRSPNLFYEHIVMIFRPFKHTMQAFRAMHFMEPKKLRLKDRVYTTQVWWKWWQWMTWCKDIIHSTRSVSWWIFPRRWWALPRVLQVIYLVSKCHRAFPTLNYVLFFRFVRSYHAKSYLLFMCTHFVGYNIMCYWPVLTAQNYNRKIWICS